MSALAIVIVCASSAFCGYVFGWMFGLRHGRDCQWCDDYFEAAEHERARRDALGQFKKQRSNNDITT